MNGIEISGLDELSESLSEMALSDAKERSAIRKAVKKIATELEKDSPKRTSNKSNLKLSKVKVTVSKDGITNVGMVKTGAWWDKFQEFGTSKSKKNVGYFERSVRKTEDEAVQILGEELLKKIK